MSNDRAEWEKLVDKSAEKFHEQAYKAVYQYHGSTYSACAADVLAAAYAVIVKSCAREVADIEGQIFTKDFLDKLATSELQVKKE